MWGQRKAICCCASRIRNTPTYVGTTLPFKPLLDLVSEHPHVCGDNSSSFATRCTSAGTPPRMWGQRVSFFSAKSCIRNTPTYVGTTGPAAPPPPQPSEHPHVCGDNERKTPDDFLNSGTPPRMWGQRRVFQARKIKRRNTPTYVGTTPPPPPPEPEL